MSYNSDELVAAVEDAYSAVPAVATDKIFVTLQSVMSEIMAVKRAHSYRMPHLKKGQIVSKHSVLPRSLLCDNRL